MRIVITLLAGLALSACAMQLTKEEVALCEGNEKCLVQSLEVKIEKAEYRREEKRIKHLEDYYNFKLVCEYRGGNVWIVRHTTSSCRGSNCPARIGDSYTCGPPLSVGGY